MEKVECLRILERMAAQSQGQIFDEYEVEHYVDSLESYGWDRVYAALRQLRKSSRKLPTVSEIESAMGVTQPLGAEQTIDMQAKLISTKINECFGVFGYTNPQGARERIGEVGWAALGGTRGWVELCQLPSYDDLPTRLAQIREAAKALMLLPPEKRQGQFAPPERPAIDHTAARLEAAKRQLAEAKALLGIVTEAESDKQTGKLISFNRPNEAK